MPEYIDKKEIIEFLKQTRKQLNVNDCKDFYTRDNMLLNFEQYINLQPIAKVKESKQGFWVLVTEPNGKPYSYRCSVCGNDFHYIGITGASDYCPDCGAEMINAAVSRFDSKEAFNITKQSLVRIINIIKKYADEHEFATKCGGEYIMQNDEAQVDALILACNIFNILSEDNVENLSRKENV